MPSCIASSFSQGDAFISSKPERTITFTSSPPRRREERQQSIAVLPPPSTITRLPILVMWPNETDDSQSMPMWMFVGRFLAAGNVEVAAARRAGADEDRVVAFGQQRLHAVDRAGRRGTRRRDRGCSRTSSSITASGRRKCGICVRIMPPALRVLVEHDALVAERREIARDGERGRAARRRSAMRLPFFCVAALAAGARGCRPCKSAATRFRRQIATGSFSTRPRRQAGSQGRSQVRPRMPGKHVRLPVDHVGVAVAALPRSGGCIREPACAPGRPTGNRRPCGNSREPRCR